MFKKMISLFILLLLIVSTTIVLGDTESQAGCLFSYEYQGAYVTQDTVTDNRVRYSQIDITEESIPIWGICHERIDHNNVILKIGSEETTCYRCFSIKLVARNILSVITGEKDYSSKCYTSIEKAIGSCPMDDVESTTQNYYRHEIILYKTKESDGSDIRREYCPFTGKYKIIYNIDDGSEDRIECPNPVSELHSCPTGSSMNLRLRNCSFDNLDVTFECLGSWQGLHKNYLALMNSNIVEGNNKQLGPKYRCAIYTSVPETGVITLSFSNDSTCSSINAYNHNNNAAVVYGETITMHPIVEENWPTNQFCNFPNWMHGEWQHMSISTSTIVYRDHSSFKTYTMKCLQNVYNAEKFYVLSKTQCGEVIYNCINVKQRTENILEFQMAIKSAFLNNSIEICDDQDFIDIQWLTQARLLNNNVKVSPCPVNGEFTGVLPDAEGVCTKLSSNCTSPDIMYYEVSFCENNFIAEERQYQCLGQWEENNLVYTYTRRQDIGTYECFVGAMVTDTKIFIKEAGEYCQRYANPHKYGMELNKQDYCKELPSTTPSIIVHPATRHHKSSVDMTITDDQQLLNEIDSNTNIMKMTTVRPSQTSIISGTVPKIIRTDYKFTISLLISNLLFVYIIV